MMKPLNGNQKFAITVVSFLIAFGSQTFIFGSKMGRMTTEIAVMKEEIKEFRRVSNRFVAHEASTNQDILHIQNDVEKNTEGIDKLRDKVERHHGQ